MFVDIKFNNTATYSRPIVNRILYGTRVGSCHLFSLCTPREKYTAVYDNNFRCVLFQCFIWFVRTRLVARLFSI